jgi:hypothetical protein
MIGLIVAVALSGAAPHDHTPLMHTPWRMGDWATCRDGTQTYSRNAEYPLEPPAEAPCAQHGGVRAYGIGKRLNER